jgi:hypothetical protein
MVETIVRPKLGRAVRRVGVLGRQPAPQRAQL